MSGWYLTLLFLEMSTEEQEKPLELPSSIRDQLECLVPREEWLPEKDHPHNEQVTCDKRCVRIVYREQADEKKRCLFTDLLRERSDPRRAEAMKWTLMNLDKIQWVSGPRKCSVCKQIGHDKRKHNKPSS